MAIAFAWVGSWIKRLAHQALTRSLRLSRRRVSRRKRCDGDVERVNEATRFVCQLHAAI
jgi:hypothetical protein